MVQATRRLTLAATVTVGIFLLIPIGLLIEIPQRTQRSVEQVLNEFVLARQTIAAPTDGGSGGLGKQPAVGTSAARSSDSATASAPASAAAADESAGDPVAGEAIFFENELANCGKCHRVGDRGGEIGPDLTNIGEKPAAEILESIAEPSKQITEGYETLVVQTFDGQIFSGIVKEDSDERLVLMDADGNETIIPQDDVDGVQPGLSAMPAGMAESLSPQQMQDLLAFLVTLKGNE